MSPGAAVRSIASARAGVYAALALVFQDPTESWRRDLRRLIAALVHVAVWHSHPMLEKQVGALRWHLPDDGDRLTDQQHVLSGGAGRRGFISDLERMARLCTDEAKAWVANDGAAAQDYLRLEHLYLVGLARAFPAEDAPDTDEGVYSTLVRTARQYVSLDERLVASLLVAVEYARSEV